MAHEWRDSENPYRTGPSLTVSGGRLSAAGRFLTALPQDQWVHFDITAPVGGTAPATWNLEITLPGQAPQKYPGLRCHPEWRRLEWLGFSSSADRQTSYYLDNIKLTSDGGVER